eukprot:scaffold654868_cov67-Prasinocladus_malaysianus.AAC.1
MQKELSAMNNTYIADKNNKGASRDAVMWFWLRGSGGIRIHGSDQSFSDAQRVRALEAELKDYRERARNMLEEKDKEIAALK